MSCPVGDIGCGITQALMPVVYAALAIIVLGFIGAFGGKPGKFIAVVGIILLFLWYIGLEWLGIPLAPIRSYFGMALMPLMVKAVRREKPQPTSKWTYAGVALIVVAVVLFVLIESKVI